MREKKSLINGRNLTCPRCKKQNDILSYIPLMQIEEYAHETNVVYKAPCCKWIFSLSDNLIFEVLSGRLVLSATAEVEVE